MADVFDRAMRSRVMARIRSKDTGPELLLRSYLHRRGLRFRLHVAELPGRPDIVLARHRVVLFVHGCFWHTHSGCPLAATPVSNKAFWRRKLQGNRSRDERQIAALRAAGWRVGVFWECAARKGVVDRKALNDVEVWISRGSSYREFPVRKKVVVSRRG
jgi:DNA mismatch endonuclease, patch repair protein